ncbi:MAG: ABC transporter permease [Bryobacteraceae bacterium]
MRLLYTLRLRLRSLFRRSAVERDLDEEIAYHVARRVEEEIARGVEPTEARRIAIRAMEGIEQHKEACRDMRRTTPVEDLIRDLRYAARSLLRSPAFTAVTLLSLALGIGANTAIYSLIDKLLVESLPVENPRELVMFQPEGYRSGWIMDRSNVSYPLYRGLSEAQDGFTGLLAERSDNASMEYNGVTQRVAIAAVSGNYFQVLGVRPAAGRLLSPDDNRTPGAHPVAVLTHGFWRERFGADPAIAGRSVRINGYPFTIAGVAQSPFNGLEVGGTLDVIVPAMMLRQVTTYGDALESRSSYIFNLYGRLKPGVTRAGAEARLQPLYLAQVEQDVAAAGARGPSDDRWRESKVHLVDGRRGTSRLRSTLQTPLTALLAMTVVVLLIACANIAGLLMARSAARAKEIGIRLAIGASRRRIARQLLTESLLLAAAGGLLGLLVANATLRALVAQAGESGQRLLAVIGFLDTRVLGVAFAASLITGLTFGVLPALRASRQAAVHLKAGASSERAGHVRLRKALVTAQVALGIVLVAAAGLFQRTLQNLRTTETGFEASHLAQFSLNAGYAGHQPAGTAVLFDRILSGLRAIPGVESATAATFPIFANSHVNFWLEVEGYNYAENENRSCVSNALAPGYFRIMGMKLLRGRDFAASDARNAPRVTIVNETFARKYFPNRDPIGHRIRLSWGLGTRYSYEIVGVVKDARLANLRDAPERNFFMPLAQWDPLNSAVFYVRVRPGGVSADIRNTVQRLAPAIPITGYRTIEQQIDRLLTPERLVASLSLAFGLLATGLAAFGLYGVTAFSVARRTREIGIRIALGAQRSTVLGMVLTDVGRMAAFGIAIGLALSLALSRYVESQLFGVAPRDVATLAAAALLLSAAALFSGWLPARRATRVDPVRALRQD